MSDEKVCKYNPSVLCEQKPGDNCRACGWSPAVAEIRKSEIREGEQREKGSVLTTLVKLDPGAHPPTRAHMKDAGLDLYAVKGQIVPPHGSAVFDTGVHMQLPEGTCGLLVAKSGLNVKNGITSTGLIDEGYTGSICVKLYNHGDEPYSVADGEKISQIVLLPVFRFGIRITGEIAGGERGDGGFGSSGKF